LTTLVLLLFITAWAAIAFAIIRGLVVAWGFDRRVAFATAVAVAGAFALGAISPLALPSRRPSAGGPAPAVPAAAVADSAHSATCPAGAVVSGKTTPGHVDTFSVGSSAPAAAGSAFLVAADEPIQLGGWIVSDAGPPATICVLVDGRPGRASMRYGIARPDVASALGKSGDLASGFAVRLKLPAGNHVVAVGAVEPDGHAIDAIQDDSLNVQVR
jgi:hypothetical protein